jgi:hypothetical protein
MKPSLSAGVLTCLVTAMFAFSTLADELPDRIRASLSPAYRAGAPWVVEHAFATLSDEGRLRVDIRGLILPALGTAGPVTAVAASVACSDMVAATSAAVPLASDGNAEIHAKLQVPSPCFGTIILVRIAAVNGNALPAPGPWIAASGVSKDSDDN